MQAVKQEQKAILDLNKSQLRDGYGSDGKDLGEYSQATQDIAENSNPRPIRPKIAGQPYNFEWTGQFIKRMFIKATLKSADIFSRVNYAGLLEDKFGHLFGLYPENQEKANQKLLKPWILKDIRKLLKL